MTDIIEKTRNVHITFNYPKFSNVKISDNEIHLQSLEMLQLIAAKQVLHSCSCCFFNSSLLCVISKILLSIFEFKGGGRDSVRNETSCIERLNYKIHLSFFRIYSAKKKSREQRKERNTSRYSKRKRFITCF